MSKTQLEITLSMLEADRKSLKQERDNYRDLCVELKEEIQYLLRVGASGLTKGDIASTERQIARAESFLGESNAN